MSDATSRAGFACPDLTTFASLDVLGLEVAGSGLSPVVRCRRVGLWSLMTGTDGAAARAESGTPWSVGWRTNRWGDDRRRCW